MNLGKALVQCAMLNEAYYALTSCQVLLENNSALQQDIDIDELKHTLDTIQQGAVDKPCAWHIVSMSPEEKYQWACTEVKETAMQYFKNEEYCQAADYYYMILRIFRSYMPRNAILASAYYNTGRSLQKAGMLQEAYFLLLKCRDIRVEINENLEKVKAAMAECEVSLQEQGIELPKYI